MGISPSTQPSELDGRTVKAWPGLLTAMLKHEVAAAGRIYLLMRFIDSEGSGWLTVDHVRFVFTHKESPLKVMGWRRLRQILHGGEGIFWKRDDRGRIWIIGAGKIADRLDVERLTGQPVELPLRALVGGMKVVRANFYASYHSGRLKDNPISRGVLQQVTGVPVRTQRVYDDVTGTGRQKNICVGEPYSREGFENCAYDRGRAAFVLRDAKGNYGPKGGRYLAWHLPNHYDGPHKVTYRGRQKKINQHLNALVIKGMRANGQDDEIKTLFWPKITTAGKSWSRDTSLDAYWPECHTKKKAYKLWGVLTANQ